MDTSSESRNSRNYEDIELLDISSSSSTYKGPDSKRRKMSNKFELDDETDENDDLTKPFLKFLSKIIRNLNIRFQIYLIQKIIIYF